MKKITFSLFTAFVLSSVSLLSYADIRIVNNTDYFATGKTGMSPCSSAAGDMGVIKPHQVTIVPQYGIDMFCSMGCTGEVFLSKNCTGKKIATARIEPHKGIVSFNNLDKEHIVIIGGGFEVVINPVVRKSIFDLIF